MVHLRFEKRQKTRTTEIIDETKRIVSSIPSVVLVFCPFTNLIKLESISHTLNALPVTGIYFLFFFILTSEDVNVYSARLKNGRLYLVYFTRVQVTARLRFTTSRADPYENTKMAYLDFYKKKKICFFFFFK